MAISLLSKNRDLRDQVRDLEEAIDELEHKHKLELSELRRQHVYKMASKSEEFASLEVENRVLQARLEEQEEVIKDRFELNNRELELDQREERIELQEKHHLALRADEQKLLDIQHQQLTRARVEFEEEKKRAHDKVYDLGTAEGFHNGFIEGIDVMMKLQDKHVDFAKLQALVSTQLAHKDGKEQTEASKELADSFAKHLTGTIEKLLDSSSEE